MQLLHFEDERSAAGRESEVDGKGEAVALEIPGRYAHEQQTRRW